MTIRAGARAELTAALARIRTSPQSGRILLYHDVDGFKHDGLPWELFSAQLDWLGGLGLGGRSVLSEVTTGFPAGTVGISIDDGRTSSARASEAILGRGWTLTLFVVPRWVDAERAGHLRWPDLRRLADAGVEIGAHGLGHESLCALAQRDQERLLLESRRMIEDRIGRPVAGLAYPFGSRTRSTIQATARAGYLYGCGVLPGVNDGSRAYDLRRNEIVRTDRTPLVFRGKLAGADDWMRPIRAIEMAIQCAWVRVRARAAT